MASSPAGSSTVELAYTLDSIRDVHQPIVYGLYDGDELFYIGSTPNPAKRFADYIGSHYPSNLPLCKRLSALGDSVRIRVFVVCRHDRLRIEHDLIRQYASVRLLNRSGNWFYGCHACGEKVERPSKGSKARDLCNACAGAI